MANARVAMIAIALLYSPTISKSQVIQKVYEDGSGLIYATRFDYADTTEMAADGWSWPVGQNPTIDSTGQRYRDGSACVLTGGDDAIRNFTGVDDVYFIFNFRMSNLASTSGWVTLMLASASNHHMSFLPEIDASSGQYRFAVRDATGATAGYTSWLDEDTWYTIAGHVDVNNSGSCTIYIDGVSDFSDTGDYKGGTNNASRVTLTSVSSNASEFIYGDFVLYDGSGAAPFNAIIDTNHVVMPPSSGRLDVADTSSGIMYGTEFDYASATAWASADGWTINAGTLGMSTTTRYATSGVKSLQLDGGDDVVKTFSAQDTIYFAFNFRYSGSNIGNQDLLRFGAPNHSVQIVVANTFSGKANFIIKNATSGTLATGQIKLIPGEWYQITGDVKLHDTAGFVDLYVDGMYDCGYTGDTLYTGDAHTKFNVRGSSSTTCDWFVGDLVFYNGSGSAPYDMRLEDDHEVNKDL